MEDIKFVWDENKNKLNQKKHGISFGEAKTVFFDQNGRLISDPDHSETEDRFILLGFSSRLNLVVVCHCYREDGETVRIISARKATKSEKSQYKGF